MAKSSGPIVGLDIGSAFIKVVEVAFKAGRPEITAVGIMPTPLDSVIQGLVIDPPAMGVVIRHLLDISGIRSRRVVSSIAGANNVSVRIIEVPKMSDKDLAETMKYEIDRFVPFAHGQEIERDYQPLPLPAPNEANMQVILAVAVQDVVTSHMQALTAAGLSPAAIEAEPLAVVRALTAFGEDGHRVEETIGIVNIGASNTELSVVTGGMLIFPRTISIGGDSLTKAIAENLGMRVDAAERLKRQYAAVDLERIGQLQSAPDFDTGFGDFGSPPGDSPFLDFNAPGGGGAAAPGLNPFLYNSPAGGAAEPGAAPFGVAPPPEDEPAAGAANVFDLGAAGPEIGAPSGMGANAPVGGLPASPFGGGSPFETPAPFGSPDAEGGMAPAGGLGGDFGGFDLGDGSTPMAEPAGSADDDARQVQDILAPVLNELVAELRRSLEYYRSHNPNLPITRLLMTGGTCRMPNLNQFFEKELGIPTLTANPLMAATVQSSMTPLDWLQDIAPVLSIAMGLAEREMVDVPKGYVPAALAQAAT